MIKTHYKIIDNLRTDLFTAKRREMKCIKQQDKY